MIKYSLYFFIGTQILIRMNIFYATLQFARSKGPLENMLLIKGI